MPSAHTRRPVVPELTKERATRVPRAARSFDVQVRSPGGDVDHPADAEPVDAHTELVAPHLLLQRDRHGRTVGQHVPAAQLVGVVAAQADRDYGHRRVLAAVEAGRTEVPVVVYTGTLTDATAAEIDRILGQHAENTHRTGLTVGETVAAFGQLAALGVAPARIARRSKTPRRTVDAALAAAASEVAAKATERWDFLTLDDAAALAEFDDDPDAIKALVATKAGENTAHVAQRLRDQRDTTRASARRTAEPAAFSCRSGRRSGA